MKKIIVIFVAFLILTPATMTQMEPLRYAKEVYDVTKPYSGAAWVISPEEEPTGDHNVSNAPECDIKGVVALNDRRRIRIDIHLYYPISYRWKVAYGVKFQFKHGDEEAYLFFPVSKRFFYVLWKNGRKVKEMELTQNQASDWTGVTTGYVGNRAVPDSVVYLIIDKDKHIARSGYGQKLWLLSHFSSGYIQKNLGDLRDADKTNSVKLGFIR